MQVNLGSSIIYSAVNPNGSLNTTSTANAPGHWYNTNGEAVAWGANAQVFSELNIGNMVANIGQYPNRCMPGDVYTIKQRLVYTKSASEKAEVTLIFTIKIKDDVVSGIQGNDLVTFDVYPNPTKRIVSWHSKQNWILMDALGNELTQGKSEFVNLSSYTKGVYVLKVGEKVQRIIKE